MAESISFDKLSSFPQLFKAYCTDYDRLADHFAGDWSDPEIYKEAAKRVDFLPRNRQLLSEVLTEQNRSWEASEESIRNAGRLGSEDALSVVTGQQVGLFGGPLYTLFKTITTIQLANELETRLDRPVIPIFWLEGEDHDFEEIATTWLLKRNEPVSVTLEKESQGRSVGSILWQASDDVLFGELKNILPPSDFREDVFAALRHGYQEGQTLLDAFARLMHRYFPDVGLVCINSTDARLKAEVAPLFERELQEHAESARRLEEASARLTQEFHAQVQTSPTNLFVMDEGGRTAIDASNGSFKNRSTGEVLSSSELRKLIKEQPHQVSPNVVLRPLVQDALLPTLTYVAGPGEVSYFAQLKGVYEWAEIPMPIIYPRASATLIESKVEKVLDKFNINMADLEGDIEPLFEKLIRERMSVDIEAVFGDLTAAIHKSINEAKPEIEEVDRTLGPSTEATRAAIANELGDLESRVVKAEKRMQDEVRQQLEKAKANLFPNETLQERLINPVYFFNKYGASLVDSLQKELSLDTSTHQLISL